MTVAEGGGDECEIPPGIFELSPAIYALMDALQRNAAGGAGRRHQRPDR